jgi:hypothetical protein
VRTAITQDLLVTIKRQELYTGLTKFVAVSVLLAAATRCNLSASDSYSYPDSGEGELRKNEEDNLKKQIRAILGRLQPVKSAAVAILFSGLLATSFVYLAYPHEQSEAQTTKSAPASRPPIGVTTSTQNPLQVAILHWYDANLTTQFTTGTAPNGVAFDGSSIWVANNGSNNVTKLRASDGAALGTFAAGTFPAGVVFDGTNIWVANNGSNNLTKMSTSGTVLGTFAVGINPAGIAFDGTNIWVGNFGSNNVTKLSLSGTVLGTFPAGSGPSGVAYDGGNIWVTDFQGGTVTKLKASTGAPPRYFHGWKGAGWRGL